MFLAIVVLGIIKAIVVLGIIKYWIALPCCLTFFIGQVDSSIRAHVRSMPLLPTRETTDGRLVQVIRQSRKMSIFYLFFARSSFSLGLDLVHILGVVDFPYECCDRRLIICFDVAELFATMGFRRQFITLFLSECCGHRLMMCLVSLDSLPPWVFTDTISSHLFV